MELGFSSRCCDGGRGLKHGPGSSKHSIIDLRVLVNGPYTNAIDPTTRSARPLVSRHRLTVLQSNFV
jgi:hypothetical protein